MWSTMCQSAHAEEEERRTLRTWGVIKLCIVKDYGRAMLITFG